MSVMRTVALGVLTAVVVFGTTYKIGGIFVYPRAFMAIFAVWLLWRDQRLRFLARPLLFVNVIVLFALANMLAIDEWRHAFNFLLLLFRGVVLTSLAAIGLAHCMGISVASNKAEGTSLEEVTRILCIALLTQIVVTIVHLSMPEFRTAYLEWVNLADAWREMASLGLPRFSGIGGISIYDTSIAYCVMGAVLLLGAPSSRGDTWLRAGTVAVVFVLCILHGRTGLLFAVGLLLLLGWQDVQYRTSRPSVSLRAGLALTALAFLAFNFVDEDLLNFILEFSGELFINLFAGDGLRSGSTDDFVENHLHLPDWGTILGGSGLWAQPDMAEAVGATYTTDSGLLLLINFGGIPLLIAMAAALFWVVQSYARGFARLDPNHGSPSGSQSTRIFTAFLLAMFALISWKGPIFLSEHCMTALFLVLAIKGRFSRD